MKVDPAINEAIDACLTQADDQTADFQRRFRELIIRVLEGNNREADTRRVVDLVQVDPEDEA